MSNAVSYSEESTTSSIHTLAGAAHCAPGVQLCGFIRANTLLMEDSKAVYTALAPGVGCVAASESVVEGDPHGLYLGRLFYPSFFRLRSESV